MKKYLLTLLIVWTACVALKAQYIPEERFYDESNNKGKAILMHFNFGTHLPAASMAKRFGQDMSLGGGLEQLSANNFILGVEGHYFFGSEVKEDPLSILRTPAGDLIGTDQFVASVVLKQRGFYVGANVGKLFIFDASKRSGLRVTCSAGWMQHKFRLQDDGQSLPLVEGDYAKGFDRLTGGLTFAQFIGWQHLSVNRRKNWYIGFELTEGFTRSLRDWDFAEKRKLDERRLDLRIGLRAGWTLPFYPKSPEQIYY
ncbi:MAG: hypothetical protein ACK5SQ_12130 [Chitinophagales bacterium]|jgi:hypothetical protein